MKELNFLKEILSVPTVSGKEDKMIEYIETHCNTNNIEFERDMHNNLYITKGKADFFPCVVAHMDTVHKIQPINVIEEDRKKHGKVLRGMSPDTNKPVGIGGDDKVGVFLCLEMIKRIDNIKAAFFVSEEIGCVGSRLADARFFGDVGYAIQFDSPYRNHVTLTSNGVRMFDKEGKFFGIVKQQLDKHIGQCLFCHHPYTDVYALKTMFDFSCLNLPVGYYDYHTVNEYVAVDDVKTTMVMSEELIRTLGCIKYPFVDNSPQKLWNW